MAKMTWTAKAQRWLVDIFEYIAADNPQAADDTVNAIYDRIQALANFPEMGASLLGVEPPCADSPLRSYRIAYPIKNDGGIDVLGIFHGALDISKYQL